MRIGIVTVWQERGAAYVSWQYRDALEKEHEVFIYARGGESYAIGDSKWDDARVTWGRKIPLHVPTAIDLQDFERWLLRNKIELVFFNEQQWWDPILLCIRMGIRIGAYIDYYTKETVPFFKAYDFVLCNTKRHYGVFSWHPQSLYIPWGTDLGLFKPDLYEPITEGCVTFFHSAGMSPERKGTDLVIQAFPQLRGKAKLVIHAQTDIKKVYPQLKEVINALIQEKKLVLREETVSAPGLYHLGDVYVYPSRLDGIGLSLPEALACGLPVITSDNAPMNEFITDKKSLIVIDKFYKRQDNYYWPMCEPNLDSLREVMQGYVDSYAMLSEYKKAARKKAEKELDWFVNAKPLCGFIKTLTRVPIEKKAETLIAIETYEKKRGSWRTRLYRKFPHLFFPFRLIWPFVKRRYISYQ